MNDFGWLEAVPSLAEEAVMRTYLTGFLLAVIVTATGCDGGNGASVNAKAEWPAPVRNVNSRGDEIAVLSGTTFSWGGVRCQLLGVKESDDLAVRKRADEFARAWFKSIGNLIAVYNNLKPLTAADGTPVVWIRGYDTSLSCLSEELVRTGLAELDEAWPNYTFDVSTKDGKRAEDWRGILLEAKERGEKPRVLFEWPTK